jgi:hypothetical protein
MGSAQQMSMESLTCGQAGLWGVRCLIQGQCRGDARVGGAGSPPCGCAWRSSRPPCDLRKLKNSLGWGGGGVIPIAFDLPRISGPACSALLLSLPPPPLFLYKYAFLRAAPSSCGLWPVALRALSRMARWRWPAAACQSVSMPARCAAAVSCSVFSVQCTVACSARSQGSGGRQGGGPLYIIYAIASACCVRCAAVRCALCRAAVQQPEAARWQARRPQRCTPGADQNVQTCATGAASASASRCARARARADCARVLYKYKTSCVQIHVYVHVCDTAAAAAGEDDETTRDTPDTQRTGEERDKRQVDKQRTRALS